MIDKIETFDSIGRRTGYTKVPTVFSRTPTKIKRSLINVTYTLPIGGITIPFNVVDIDENLECNTVNNSLPIVVKESGVYRLTASVYVSAVGTYGLIPVVNGVLLLDYVGFGTSALVNFVVQGTYMFKLNAGDSVNLYISSSGVSSILANPEDLTRMELERLM